MWFWLALASSILGAVDIILNKYILNKVSAGVLTWALFTLTIPLLVLLVFKEGIPAINTLFLVGVIGSALTFALARIILNSLLKENLISQIFPLTAFSGVFTYIFGLLFLSESIRFIPLLGLLAVLLGSYILNVDQAIEDFLKPFKLLFLTKKSLMLLFAIIFGSLSAILDKLGVINTDPASPAFVILIEQIIMAALLTGYLVSTESKTWVRQVKNNLGILSVNSLVFLVVSFLVIYAYLGGPVALVVGIKRLQIFFILILGYLFLKDKPTKHAWLATVIMILGAIMIRVG